TGRSLAMKPVDALSTIELDCRAQQCPVPVLRLAKAVGELGDGGVVLIRADDPAFPKDLRAWARSAGSRIVRFDDRGGYFEATIRVGGDPSDLDDIADDLAFSSSTRPRQTFDLRGQPPSSLLDIVARACARAEPGA